MWFILVRSSLAEETMHFGVPSTLNSERVNVCQQKNSDRFTVLLCGDVIIVKEEKLGGVIKTSVFFFFSLYEHITHYPCIYFKLTVLTGDTDVYFEFQVEVFLRFKDRHHMQVLHHQDQWVQRVNTAHWVQIAREWKIDRKDKEHGWVSLRVVLRRIIHFIYLEHLCWIDYSFWFFMFYECMVTCFSPSRQFRSASVCSVY